MTPRKAKDRDRKRFSKWKDKQYRWKRSGRIIKHHIINRCNGGKDNTGNLLHFDEAREKAWHFLFGNLSFREVAELLLRVADAKERQDLIQRIESKNV